MSDLLLTAWPSVRRLTLQLGVAALARLSFNTARRFAYPFAPAFSRGLGVQLMAITSLVAANQVTGVLSPAFGPLGDRWGYRRMMPAGSAMLAVGMLCGGLALVCLVWGLRSFHFSEPTVY